MGSHLALVLALALQDQPFVPALQHGTRTPAQWIDELQGERRVLDAVWSLYYLDDHSPEVLAALKSALDESRTAECRMAADSILCQWRVPHEVLSADVYSGGITFAEYIKGFAPPIASMEGDSRAREEALRSPDEHRRTSAALGMLEHKEQVSRALDALLGCGRPEFQTDVPTRNLLEPYEASAVDEWTCAHMGSAYFETLGRRLSDAATGSGLLEGFPNLRTIIDSRTTGSTALLPWLERMAASSKEANEMVAPLIGRILDEDIDYLRNSHWHGRLNRLSRRTAADPDEFLEAHYLDRARAVLARSGITYPELLQVHAAALRYPAVAALCMQTLPDLLDRRDEIGLESLCILGHLGSADPRARTAYLRVLNDWTNFDREGLDRLPFWKTHDEDTRKAFVALLGHAIDAGYLFEQICFAGELDAAHSEIARLFLERTKGNYAWAVSRGFLGNVVVDTSLSLAGQVNQIALNIATKQSHGGDFADYESQLVAILELPYTSGGAGGYDDQVQWGFFHAQTLRLRSPAMVHVALHYIQIGDTMEGFSTHSDAAIPYLESIPLEVEDHVALRKLRPTELPGSDWHPIKIAYEQFGGEPLSKLSLEDVPRWRHRIFAGEPRYLERLLRVTPITEREVPYLAALLERGSVDQRLWALDLVEQFGIDASEVRACLTRLADGDPDLSVRRAARRHLDRPVLPR